MTNKEMVQMVGYDYMVDVANRAVFRNDRLAAYISDHFHCSRQTSCDVASEVIEDICRRAVSHNLYVSSILTALRGYARNAIKKRRQTIVYEE